MSSGTLAERLLTDVEAAPMHLHANLRQASQRITDLEDALDEILHGYWDRPHGQNATMGSCECDACSAHDRARRLVDASGPRLADRGSPIPPTPSVSVLEAPSPVQTDSLTTEPQP